MTMIDINTFITVYIIHIYNSTISILMVKQISKTKTLRNKIINMESV